MMTRYPNNWGYGGPYGGAPYGSPQPYGGPQPYGAPYGGPGQHMSRGFDAGADPLARFQEILANPATRQRLASDPDAVLGEMGQMPPEVRAELAPYLRQLAQTSSGQAWTRGLEDPEVSVDVRWYGVVISLNNQATTDLVTTAALTTAIIGGVSAVLPEPRARMVLGVISALIGVMAAVIRLVNRGNGVDLTIPWTALLPPPLGLVKMVPTPR